jgi:hypothetical protein
MDIVMLGAFQTSEFIQKKWFAIAPNAPLLEESVAARAYT